MNLNNNQLYKFFKERGITYLHHANTVATSMTFITSNGLVSRSLAEKNGLFQTLQDSDEDDKINDVWDDIFFDTTDLHGHFPRQNLYGPVLFRYQVDLILDQTLEVFITKNNPIFWSPGASHESKYFVDMEDVYDNWDKYLQHRKMVTIRKPKRIIGFENLDKIILDDPKVQVYGDTDLFGECRNAITKLVAGRYQIIHRACGSCFCQQNYLNQYSAQKLSKFFLPADHHRFVNR